MAYSTGILNHRITIQNRKAATTSKWGMEGNGIEWEDTAQLWANIEWTRGKSAMNAGALDAYAVIMVRIRWTEKVNMRSRVIYEGDTYQIVPETYHIDRENNTIQFHAQLIVPLSDPEPEPTPTPTPEPSNEQTSSDNSL